VKEHAFFQKRVKTYLRLNFFVIFCAHFLIIAEISFTSFALNGVNIGEGKCRPLAHCENLTPQKADHLNKLMYRHLFPKKGE